nr:hypothetical protein [Proteus mirabilis]
RPCDQNRRSDNQSGHYEALGYAVLRCADESVNWLLHHTESVRFVPTLNAPSTAPVGRTDNCGSTNVRR